MGEEGLVVPPVRIALDAFGGEDGQGYYEKRGRGGLVKFCGGELDESSRGEREKETEAEGWQVEVALGEYIAAEGVDVRRGKERNADPESGKGGERGSADEVGQSGDCGGSGVTVRFSASRLNISQWLF